MKTLNVIFENGKVEEVKFNGQSMTIQESGLSHTDIQALELVVEYLQEINEGSLILVNGKLWNISAKVEIADLEDLGWDFENIYDEVSRAQGISEEEAKSWEKSHYHVRLKVDQESNLTYSLCQNTDYGNEEFNQGDCGDNEAGLLDFIKLIQEKKTWDLHQQ